MSNSALEAHKTQVVRILADLSGGISINQPKAERLKNQAYSRAEIYQKATCRPRAVRCALTALQEDGLVEKSSFHENSAETGLNRQDRFRLNLQRADDILPYIDFAPPPKRAARTG